MKLDVEFDTIVELSCRLQYLDRILRRSIIIDAKFDPIVNVDVLTRLLCRILY